MSEQSNANFDRAQADAERHAERLAFRLENHGITRDAMVLLLTVTMMEWYSRGSKDGSQEICDFTMNLIGASKANG